MGRAVVRRAEALGRIGGDHRVVDVGPVLIEADDVVRLAESRAVQFVGQNDRRGEAWPVGLPADGMVKRAQTVTERPAGGPARSGLSAVSCAPPRNRSWFRGGAAANRPGTGCRVTPRAREFCGRPSGAWTSRIVAVPGAGGRRAGEGGGRPGRGDRSSRSGCGRLQVCAISPARPTPSPMVRVPGSRETPLCGGRLWSNAYTDGIRRACRPRASIAAAPEPTPPISQPPSPTDAQPASIVAVHATIGAARGWGPGRWSLLVDTHARRRRRTRSTTPALGHRGVRAHTPARSGPRIGPATTKTHAPAGQPEFCDSLIRTLCGPTGREAARSTTAPPSRGNRSDPARARRPIGRLAHAARGRWIEA